MLLHPLTALHTLVERAVTVISATRNVASTFAFFIIIFLSDKKIRAVNALTNMLIFIVATDDNKILMLLSVFSYASITGTQAQQPHSSLSLI